MTPEQFTYWLQGFLELTNSKDITVAQIESIKEHLGLVFNKKTKPVSTSTVLPKFAADGSVTKVAVRLDIEDEVSERAIKDMSDASKVDSVGFGGPKYCARDVRIC